MLTRFLLAGTVNTCVGFAIVALSRRIGATEYVSNAVGLVGGLALGFTLNRGWTFRSTRKALVTMPLYLAAFAIAYFVNLCVLAVCLKARLDPNLAQGAALASYSSAFYLLCRSLVFRTSST